MQYTQNEGKIRSELKIFWTVIEDILVNPKGEPFTSHDKVQKLRDRCPRAHDLMCLAYQQLLEAMGYNSRKSSAQENHNKVLKELGLEYSLNLLANRILCERALGINS